MAEARLSHNVYVVELDPAVLKNRRFRASMIEDLAEILPNSGKIVGCETALRQAGSCQPGRC